ncbi:translation initiation factor IF-2 subunit beta [Candidatus Woesearchaeota archaeon]|jgi:translation initiation factor 2 subunit 2|nr:translation initiation factor IF-2 subunit beta [Candidatus Woesearchaeota archaeon]MBT4835171.1 translation initiation factor IF-2 subunit beta [Candidatus Woesearchaeota archaeon]MBT6735432.1 translation initiation factor IF-2 subunit beta [Candidatus Woesearchaeota archaeon]MBT7169447.1 translation initiation factor IF-2 subunit beta [Candidatus Woesearchaeota archaeon]MBT7474760.1 translation initiation factor IF-2 subunit beta [Candidatus Woesearchaeota archaeon]
MDYEKLLDRAEEKLPEKSIAKDRFEMPKVKGRIEGNKTTITNFNQIATILRRDVKHIQKYLLRELAAPGVLDGQRLTLGRKISSILINKKLEKYANEFVICRDCKKPDTKILKEGKIQVLKCTACGAKHPIKSKI